ncbi:Non-heme iron oxygenase ferredoxin subunit (modular protein) [Candidatus Nitrosocosmicus franklandus]|uniref:Non-heme iron oxygenase ferredoxin subunit (Modular protein) n=2 Tax=Candidatus Nitrosocosmicus franklandianus TaxID=1798806 RepID=A0A484IBL4_9ARCH|nr:Non-heme iron oxygenase ferredoxin subunit (modular protein) [Candidatus Nitrosocosmicus franklandus]
MIKMLINVINTGYVFFVSYYRVHRFLQLLSYKINYANKIKIAITTCYGYFNFIYKKAKYKFISYSSYMTWIKVCELSSLDNNNIVSFNHDNKEIMVVKAGDNIYAADRICTHAFADLSEGILNEDEKTLTCPLHLSAFKLNDGVPQNPPAETPLTTYETRIENNDVLVLFD